MVEMRALLSSALRVYKPAGDVEETDVLRIVRLVESVADPWSRSEALHLTASALVVHAASGRVLLRWHEKFGHFMQVGGHGDPGEWDPLAVALREATEETGLSDLRPVERGARFAAGELVHVVAVPVPAGAGEAAHEHADLRFLLETDRPTEARPESSASPVRWMSWDKALEAVHEENLRVFIGRARGVLS
jgi:8-oxo-dGTP pyrophosphatase MutT (NUDIX family)